MTDAGMLWQPTPEAIAAAPMTRFMRLAEERFGVALPDYDALHAWSVDDREAFWSLVWDFGGVIGDKGERVLVDGDRMPGARFFPDARLNFAENLMRRTDHAIALQFHGEDKAVGSVTFAELHHLVSRLQQAFRDLGVGVGDRVAAMMPNMPETVAAMLAATSLGAIWSSCSPDFGVRGVLDRFGQIAPKVLIACDGYWYNGKKIGIGEKLGEIVANLPSLEALVVTPYVGSAMAIALDIGKAVVLDNFIHDYRAAPVTFERLPFDHPTYILYSSGTTGAPKCIVHGAGGMLLQHLKEHRLHCGLTAADRLFYFTTCGWMMWNWLVSGLASEATLILYDGSPFWPDANAMFDFADMAGISVFGTSAKFIDAVKKAGIRPRDTHDLSTVRLITSTGSPLAAEGFDFVYDAIKPGVHLASISGGTDIAACFVLGIPLKPVWRGEIQGPALGMASDVWDENGNPVTGEKGELVCTRAFPSMPVQFWNDEGGAKYRAAYFERFPGVWCHGDFAEWTEHGGMIIHGRSDATLNPGGVRIGTAEIYAQVEQLPEILESIAIGQSWDNDVRIVLFVRLAEGVVLDEALEKKIRTRIRDGASPRHVPARIVAVADIPRTKSGKITELAVRDIVHGRPIGNREALANPEALDLYRDIAELKS
ncbi:MAG TPA: acetoacetate--CoA ligase [Hyphomicrobiales bacterium]|nr:acetoacetate--CoA ligase [Hyphomicrobiales bacterium]